MRQDLELSDKIEELFRLQKGEFDPQVHLPMAEQVVAAFGKPGYFFRLTDVWEWKGLTSTLEAERDSTGYYSIQHSGRLHGGLLLGFHQKMSIVHWRDRMFSDRLDEFEKLAISYEGAEVKVVARNTVEQSSVSIPLGRICIHFSFYTPRLLWKYTV